MIVTQMRDWVTDGMTEKIFDTQTACQSANNSGRQSKKIELWSAAPRGLESLRAQGFKGM